MNHTASLPELGRRLGLRRRPRSWSGDCPCCAYPRAFALRAGQHGGVHAWCANGCDRDALDATLARALGADWTPPARPPDADLAATRARLVEAAARLFAGSTPVTASDCAGGYLHRRGIAAVLPCPALRFRGDCRYTDGSRHPALVAAVLDAAGRPVAVHRTFLDRGGHKARLDPAKMTLGPMWGGAVRLTADPSPPAVLVVGEGIETSAAAGLLLGLPAWAALSAGNLGNGLLLPEAVRAVTIAADADRVGRREANNAARRWRAEGRTVRVAIPDTPGTDFADLALARCAAETAHG